MRHLRAEGPVLASERSARETLASLLPYLWPPGRADLRLRVAAALILLVGAKLLTLAVPFLYKAAVDALDAKDAEALVIVPVGVIVAYGGARVLSQGFQQLRDAVFARVGQHAVRNIGLTTFRHLHRLSLRFHLDRRTGGLSRAIERGTKSVELLLRYVLFSVIPITIEITLVLAVFVFRYEPSFALLMGMTVAGYIAFSFLFTEWRTKFRREMNEQDVEASTKAVDSLLNYETVKYFGNEDHEARRFDVALRRYQGAAVKSQYTLALLNMGQGTIMAAGTVGIMVLAGYGVAAGRLTLGDFVLLNTFMIQLYQPLNFLGSMYRELRQALVDMESLFQLLNVPEEVGDRPDARPLAVRSGEVRFEHVSFRYDRDRRILDDVSFHVPAGGSVAIVGPTGAGKSTISRILFRFYDIGSGRVLIDGQDIRTVTQASLRAAIGIVPQDTVLFNDTIGYNIRYGRPDATQAEIEDAARLAAIHDFILSLPKGYETPVGERGLKLSGGEKQRLAIARTLLKDPPILMLDEATSSLDSHTEREIQAALRAVSRNRTTLTIAHRLTTVVDADEILVLDRGRIVERGTHRALLARGGLYARMWRRQEEAAEATERLAQTLDEEPVPVVHAASTAE